ncbi:MAG: hypothetical protein ABIV13_05595 [Fimbriimonadales bacterium]
MYNEQYAMPPTFHDFGQAWTLSVGESTFNAESNADGFLGLGHRFVRAEAYVENVALEIGDPEDPLFTLTFDAIDNSVYAEGNDPENWVPNYEHTLTYTNIQMTYLGEPISVPANPGYNTNLIDDHQKGGSYFRVTLNSDWSQLFGEAGSTAVLIGVERIPTPAGDLTATFVFSRAVAQLEPRLLPEPSSFFTLGGLALLVVLRRARNL